MSHDWQKFYTELKDYIAQNPCIEISMDATCLPSDVRPHFYQLFDEVRVNFIKNSLPASLEKAYALSRNYIEISQSIVNNLNLECIEITRASVNWFMQNPIDGLMRGLFDHLFDLLKGKIDLATFEQVATRSLEGDFRDFCSEGYKRWVALALTELMVPDKNFKVSVTDYHTDPPHMSDDANASGMSVESVPDATESKRISFDQSPLYSFIVPKVLIHSARLGGYASLHSDFIKAHRAASIVSDNREWYDIAAIKEAFGPTNLWPDITLYTSQKLSDLVLVGDYSRVARPDMIVEIMEDGGWYDKNGLKLVKRHHNILKPKFGTYVVCREPVPEAAKNELERKPVPTAFPAEGAAPEHPIHTAKDDSVPEPQLNIHLLTVGYDLAQLEPIMISLLKMQVHGAQ